MLSTLERQRIELTSTVRASTTGMLYVLDEPSVGLHPSNVQGLRKTITALAGNGNSVVVEHERELIRSADWVIELGPAAGAMGGTVIAPGTPGQLEIDPRSIMGPFLAGAAAVRGDRPARADPSGQMAIEIGDLYNLPGFASAPPPNLTRGRLLNPARTDLNPTPSPNRNSTGDPAWTDVTQAELRRERQPVATHGSEVRLPWLGTPAGVQSRHRPNRQQRSGGDDGR